MFTQFFNQLGWMLFLSVPNFTYIVTNFYSLVKPAFSALALYLPLTTFYPVIKWLITTVHDTKTLYESIYDYNGINLAIYETSRGYTINNINFYNNIKELKVTYRTLAKKMSGKISY